MQGWRSCGTLASNGNHLLKVDRSHQPENGHALMLRTCTDWHGQDHPGTSASMHRALRGE
eukprot:scaffold51559_cov31-Tisochrysis_lutea.AAC.9